ncbi:MAG: YncE family protein [Bacteroidetes bacterium]|nr:YncE family protein [Bacteroidota bacterium]
MKPVRMLSLLATLLFAGTDLFAQHHYQVIKSFPVFGMGKWDYIALGPDGNLYVSNRNRVNIINKNTGDSVGVISNTDGVHGIAFVASLNKGYTSNGSANNVTVFDIKTHKELRQITTGENPDAIFYEPWSGKIITCNGRSKDLSVIDPKTDKVVVTIRVEGRPETAVADGKGMVYVNIEDKSEIVAVDIKSNTVVHRWSLAPAEGPTGLAFDRSTQRLFAGCDNMLVVLNAVNGKIVAKLPIGDGCDGVALDNSTKEIFTSNGEGTMTVIKEITANDFSVEETVTTQKSARTIAIDESTHTIYLPAVELEPATEPGKHPAAKPGTFSVLVVK